MKLPVINMTVLNQKFNIHRFPPTTEIPIAQLSNESIFHISKTDEELSIVCRDEISLGAEKTSGTYGCLKVEGPLDFDLVGIIGRLSGILMKRDIPIFVISTFDTDYLLVRDETLATAIQVLNEDEYISITITPN